MRTPAGGRNQSDSDDHSTAPEFEADLLVLLVGSIIGLSHLAGENRKGSGLVSTKRTSGWTSARRTRAAKVRRTSFVPNYGISPRQRRFNALLG